LSSHYCKGLCKLYIVLLVMCKHKYRNVTLCITFPKNMLMACNKHDRNRSGSFACYVLFRKHCNQARKGACTNTCSAVWKVMLYTIHFYLQPVTFSQSIIHGENLYSSRNSTQSNNSCFSRLWGIWLLKHYPYRLCSLLNLWRILKFRRQLVALQALAFKWRISLISTVAC
jgi:hypothetical protein